MWCAGLTALALLTDRLTGLWLGPSRRLAHRQAVRARLISRWTALLGDLKGAFAKAGQFASLRHDVLPKDVAEALATLRDRVPPMPPEICRSVIEEDLGAPLSDLFLSFDPQPLGAASIAQAHRARLPDGSEVVVKVQYPWIRSSLHADLRSLRVIARAWLGGKRKTGDLLDWARLFAEFEASLRDELDFEREARAAAEIAENLAQEDQVKVPAIVDSYSHGRVLTMHFHPCVNVSDREGLARIGVEPAAILEILARAYAKQVFVDGLFHADPHPGNLFILDEPEASVRPRVLFVDFGLHRRLSPELRGSLRQGIYALLQRDLDGFVDRMDELDMIAPGAKPGVKTAVAHMFEQIAKKASSESPIPVAGSQVLGLK
ncbi:MAG: AarF/UbiB family protein, partial [Myxococcota bacterium]